MSTTSQQQQQQQQFASSEVNIINLLLEHVAYSNNLGALLLNNGKDAEAVETFHLALSCAKQTSIQMRESCTKFPSNNTLLSLQQQFDQNYKHQRFSDNETNGKYSEFFPPGGVNGERTLHCSGLEGDNNDESNSNYYIYNRIINLCPYQGAKTFQNYNTLIQFFTSAISFNLALCYHKIGIQASKNGQNNHQYLYVALHIYGQVLETCKEEEYISLESITGNCCHYFSFMIAVTCNNLAQIHKLLGNKSLFNDLMEEIESELEILASFDGDDDQIAAAIASPTTSMSSTGERINECVIRQIRLNTIVNSMSPCIAAAQA